MLDLTRHTHRRRIGLTPMIDVVFLLLVFFMLAARFGATDVVPVALAGGDAAPYEGPPRLVTVLPEGVRVNGIDTGTPVAVLEPLMNSPEDMIIVQSAEQANVQRLLDVMGILRAAGLSNLVIVE